MVTLHHVLLCLLFCAVACAGTLEMYVNANSGQDTSTCGSLTFPCASISRAVQLSQGANLSLVIYPGIYAGNVSAVWAISFAMSAASNNVTINCGGLQGLNILSTIASISGIQFVNCQNPNFGGAIVTTGTSLSVNNCTFMNNIAGYGGGAIASLSNSMLQVTSCTFVSNAVTPSYQDNCEDTCTFAGGAVYTDSTSNAIFTLSSFTNNSVNQMDFPSTGYGGAVAIMNSNYPITTSSFTDCAFNGNAVQCISHLFGGCDFDVINAYGGAIYIFQNAASFTRTSFYYNNLNFLGGINNAGQDSALEGGAVWANGGFDETSAVTFADSVFYSNWIGIATGTLTLSGGALSVGWGVFTNCEFLANNIQYAVSDEGAQQISQITAQGGAIACTGQFCSFTDTVFNGNYMNIVSAISGYSCGGALATIGSTLMFTNFTNNYVIAPVQAGGGAVCVLPGFFATVPLMANSSYFTGNYVSNPDGYSIGGAIQLSFPGSIPGYVYITGCVFVSNSASGQNLGLGGAIGTGVISSQGYENTPYNYIATFLESIFEANSVFAQSSAYSQGGAIGLSPLTLGIIQSCQFTSNSVTVQSGSNPGGGAVGGAISCDSCNIFSSQFVSNSVLVTLSGPSLGGAVFLAYNGTLSYCNFTNNLASLSVGGIGDVGGGALFTFESMIMSYCNFTGNMGIFSGSGAAFGGAVQAGDNFTVSYCNFISNQLISTSTSPATCSGGGFAGYSGVYSYCNAMSNTVVNYGQGVAQGGGTAFRNVVVTNSVFVYNSVSSPSTVYASTANGGGILAEFNVSLTDSLIAYNAASVALSGTCTGGGVSSLGGFRLNNVQVLSNSAIAPSASAPGTAVGGGLYAVTGGTGANCLFQDNHVTVGFSGEARGGAASLQSGGTFIDTQFLVNSATASSLQDAGRALGGAVFSDAGLILSGCELLSNTVLIWNDGYAQGGAVSVRNTLSVTNTTLTSNSATSNQVGSAGQALGGCITARSMSMDTCFVSSNTATANGLGAALGGGAALSANSFIANSTVEFNIAVSNGIGNGAGGAFASANQASYAPSMTISLNNVFLQSNSAQSATGTCTGGAISFPVVSAVNCIFEANNVFAEAGGFGGAIYTRSVYMNSSQLLQNAGYGSTVHGGALTVETQNVASQPSFIFNTIISGNYAIDRGGAIAAMYGADLFIGGNSQLLDNMCETCGGALTSEFGSNVTLGACVFARNTAGVGGAVCTGTGELFIGSDAYLINNTATYQGGAVDVGYCGLVTIESAASLIGNSAGSGGGAIFWDGTCAPPTIMTGLVTGNTALYGNVIASPPASIQALVTSATDCGSVMGQDLFSSTPVQIPSGCSVSATIFMYDRFNQLVQTPDGVSSVAKFTEISSDCNTACVGGTTRQVLETGFTNFSLSFNGPLGAGVCATINVTSTLADNTYAFATPVISAVIGNCTAGYGMLGGGDCAPCQECVEGTYNMNGDGACRVCFSSADSTELAMQCVGGQVFAAPGYWSIYDQQTGDVFAYECQQQFCASANNSICPVTITIDECQNRFSNAPYPGNASACSFVENWEDGRVVVSSRGDCGVVNSCADHRAGFMCGDCYPDTYSNWNGQCVDCSDPKPGLVVVVLLGLWLQVGILYVGLSNRSSGIAKTLVYFVQVALFVLSPTVFINALLSLLSYRVQAGSNCMFPRTFFQAFVMQVVTPLIMLVQLGVIYGAIVIISRVRHHKSFHFSRYLIRPILALLLGVYTPMTTAVLDVLGCREVGGYLVISSAPSLLCTGTVYTPYYIGALAVAVVYVCGLPLTMLGLLYRYRNQLRHPQTIKRYGYIYECYRENCFWWEVVVLVRRAVITGISWISTTSIRGFGLAFSSLAICGIQYWVQPYDTPLENFTEMVALLILTLLATINTSTLAASPSSGPILLAMQEVLVIVTTVGLLAVAVFASRDQARNVWERVKGIILTQCLKRFRSDQEKQLLEGTSFGEPLLKEKDADFGDVEMQ